LTHLATISNTPPTVRPKIKQWRNQMNIRHLSVVVALCVVSASIANCAEPAKTLEVLQGTWTGKETGREDAGVCKLKIEGNKMHFEGWHEKEWYKGTFKITSDQKHK
jgi:hypothetical protein